MSISVVKRNDKPNLISLTEFIIDSPSDVNSLPTTVADGSVAYTADLSAIYILKSGRWVENGGSSSGRPIYVTITDDETEGSYVSDKSLSEIASAIENNMVVYGGYKEPEMLGCTYFPVSRIVVNVAGEIIEVTFTEIDLGAGYQMNIIITKEVSGSDYVTIRESQIEIPET